MTEQLPDVWANRDFVVLRELCRRFDERRQFIDLDTIAEATGLNTNDVERAARNLERDGLVTIGSGLGILFSDVSADAFRLVGLWPTPETALDRMITALEQLAERGETEDDRSRARKILDNLRGASTQVAIGVATAAINGQLPH